MNGLAVFCVSNQLVGLSAGILTSVSLLPQLIKLIREKEADEISVLWLFILLCGLILWTYYGFLKDDMPIIVTNSFSIVVNILMIILKFKYTKK